MSKRMNDAVGNFPDGLCRHCKLPRTGDGHDPCIANLPGASFACCGHGKRPGYVCFTDGRVIRGSFESLGRKFPKHPEVTIHIDVSRRIVP